MLVLSCKKTKGSSPDSVYAKFMADVLKYFFGTISSSKECPSMTMAMTVKKHSKIHTKYQCNRVVFTGENTTRQSQFLCPAKKSPMRVRPWFNSRNQIPPCWGICSSLDSAEWHHRCSETGYPPQKTHCCRDFSPSLCGQHTAQPFLILESPIWLHQIYHQFVTGTDHVKKMFSYWWETAVKLLKRRTFLFVWKKGLNAFFRLTIAKWSRNLKHHLSNSSSFPSTLYKTWIGCNMSKCIKHPSGMQWFKQWQM